MAENPERSVARPPVGTAMGVLCIVFCSVSIASMVFAALGYVVFRFSRVVMAAMPEEAYAEVGGMFGSIAGLASVSMIITVLRGAAAGVGLAGGIGLLMSRRWSVLLCTIYGAAVVALGLFQFFFVAEKMNELAFYASDASGVDLLRATRGLAGAGGAVGLILGSAFPVVTIVLVNLPRTRAYYLSRDLPAA